MSKKQILMGEKMLWKLGSYVRSHIIKRLMALPLSSNNTNTNTKNPYSLLLLYFKTKLQIKNMASSDSEIAKEFRFFWVYKDGRVELFEPDCEKIPPSDDPTTGIWSKDVVISSEPPVSGRIFILYEAQGTKLYWQDAFWGVWVSQE